MRRIRNEAKSLLKAHRRGDAEACQVLQNLRRFADARDEQILATEVRLTEVQFALSMEYGFATWAELTAAVGGLNPIDGYRPHAHRDAMALEGPGLAPPSDNRLVAGLSMVLTHLGLEADADTVAGDTGLAFILQADAHHKPFNADVEQLDAGWWPLDEWGLLMRVEFLARTMGCPLEVLPEHGHPPDPTSAWSRDFAGPVSAALQEGRPVMAIGADVFAVFGLDSGRPPLLGQCCCDTVARLTRMPQYPSRVIIPGPPGPGMDRLAADVEALAWAVRLGRDEVGLSGRPGKSSGRRSWQLWLAQLVSAEKAGPHFWHANVLRQLRNGRRHAVAYLRAMARRHEPPAAAALEAAAQTYEAVLAALGGPLTNKDAWKSQAGRDHPIRAAREVMALEQAGQEQMTQALEAMGGEGQSDEGLSSTG
jgi:hypothetical protein